jgi:hypothetical protein
MFYDKLETAWNKVAKERVADFKDRVPSLLELSSVTISKVSENEQRVIVQFTGFSEAVSDYNDIPLLKKAIKGWLSNFCVPRIMQTNAQSYKIELSGYDVDQIEEAVVRVFQRKGNKLVPSMKCVGGPKNGQRTQDVATCMSPPSYARRTARKVSSRKNKGAISKKTKMNKITNIVSRRKLSKANARLKKARGGKF